MKRVVITGMGIVSPLGCSLASFWENLCAGRSGVRKITRFDPSDLRSRIAGEVQGFDIDAHVDKKDQRRQDRFCHYALGAADMAMEDSGVDPEREDATRLAVIVGSGIGGLESLVAQHEIMMEKGPGRLSPLMIPQMISDMAAGMIAIRYGMKGANYGVVSACATAAHAIGNAYYAIQRGENDVIIAGGTEAAVTRFGIGGFCAAKTLSQRNDDPEKASRPFDADRDGFVMGEGAAIVILEEADHAAKRGANIYCEVAGVGMTCDAYHITAPTEDGDGACRAMKLAMAAGGVGPDGIGYINAHGTSTRLNDRMETTAIKNALGEARAREIPISSTKSMTGHLLGAAAGIETAVCALAIRNGVVPPTINQETPDPDCDLDYVPNEAREVKVDACLNNSLGFGGHNACLLLKRYE